MKPQPKLALIIYRLTCSQIEFLVKLCVLVFCFVSHHIMHKEDHVTKQITITGDVKCPRRAIPGKKTTTTTKSVTNRCSSTNQPTAPRWCTIKCTRSLITKPATCARRKSIFVSLNAVLRTLLQPQKAAAAPIL